MQNLRITLVQVDQVWENKDANIALYENAIQNLETDLIVLPEMFTTGFTMNAQYLAEEMSNSFSLNWLFGKAKEMNCAFYTSFIVTENNAFYNRGVFVFPDGNFEIYDKRKSFGLSGEDKVFTAGNKSQIVEYKGWKINLQICYDLRFPEIVRNKLIDGLALYDLILYVANWPMKRSLHWSTLLQARAIENQCYVVGVNRVGTDANNLIYSGDSMMVDMLGERFECKASLVDIKTFVADMEALNNVRKMLPFLKDA